MKRKLQILLTNDDGISARGIQVLREVLEHQFEIFVVAPETERSTTGHTLSLNQPLRVRELQGNQYSCDGYPADCVFWALSHLFTKRPPDLVVSGINRGANLAQDIYYSGTCAGAREATVHSVPSIAVSTLIDHRVDNNQIHYLSAAKMVEEIIVKNVLEFMSGGRTLLNVNVPNTPFTSLKGAKLCTPGFRLYQKNVEARIDARGREYYWIGGLYQGFEPIPGTDCFETAQGFVSLTPITLPPWEGQSLDSWNKFLHTINNTELSK